MSVTVQSEATPDMAPRESAEATPGTMTIDALFGEASSSIQRDLKLNLQRLVEEGALAPLESALALAALSTASGIPSLRKLAFAKLRAQDLTEEQTREAFEIGAIMGMLNTYYKFRGFIKNGQGVEAESRYGNAGLRMNVFARPQLGKERFEMLSFAVSVYNGCESCVNSHEKVLRELGVSDAKLHDLARLAAVVHGLKGIQLGE